MLKNKFQNFEEVIIHPKNGILDMDDINAGDDDYQSLVGKKGNVIGMTKTDDDSEWLYLVRLTPMDKNDAFGFREKDLVSTGIIKKEEEFMSGESLRVRFYPDTGKSEVVYDDEDK